MAQSASASASGTVVMISGCKVTMPSDEQLLALVDKKTLTWRRLVREATDLMLQDAEVPNFQDEKEMDDVSEQLATALETQICNLCVVDPLTKRVRPRAVSELYISIVCLNASIEIQNIIAQVTDEMRRLRCSLTLGGRLDDAEHRRILSHGQSDMKGQISVVINQATINIKDRDYRESCKEEDVRIDVVRRVRETLEADQQCANLQQAWTVLFGDNQAEWDIEKFFSMFCS